MLFPPPDFTKGRHTPYNKYVWIKADVSGSTANLPGKPGAPPAFVSSFSGKGETGTNGLALSFVR